MKLCFIKVFLNLMVFHITTNKNKSCIVHLHDLKNQSQLSILEFTNSLADQENINCKIVL